MSRERNLPFEKLAEVTGISLASINSNERGALNKALLLVRESCDGMSEDEIVIMVESKAHAYRKLWPEISITPMALATHWSKLEGLLQQQSEPTTYVSHDRSECTTCDGLRFVHAFFRPPALTQFMVETAKRPKAKPPAAWLLDPSLYDEERHGDDVMTPCPDCNQAGAEIVREYLRRFNSMYAGGPRLPVPEQAAQAFGTLPTHDTEG